LPNELPLPKSHLSRMLPDVAGLVLVASGLITLAWVGWLTWYDMASWGKNIALIFFGSRAGEAISLGIGMKVVHYFLIGLALFLSGFIASLLRRKTGAIELQCSVSVDSQPEKKMKHPLECLHHFGYLASRPKSAPIPQECLMCQRLADCMVMTAFVDAHDL